MDCTATRLCAKHAQERAARDRELMEQIKNDQESAKAAGLVWEDPPPRTRSVLLSKRLAPTLNLLKAHPGRWAMIRSCNVRASANTTAQTLRKQLGPEWEFTLRDKKVYARYLGEKR